MCSTFLCHNPFTSYAKTTGLHFSLVPLSANYIAVNVTHGCFHATEVPTKDSSSNICSLKYMYLHYTMFNKHMPKHIQH